MVVTKVDPKDYKPGKKLLLGGGQFANRFMIVDLISIDKAENAPIPCEYKARLLQKTYSGIEEFNPWLASWWLAEMPKGWGRKGLGEYTFNFDGSVSKC